MKAKLFLWSAWLLYVGYLLLSDFPPGPSLLHTSPETVQTAIDLSLNFWFVLPILSPASAPVLNPALEGLFNIVVAWGLLFWGFWVDGRNQRWSIAPFLIGTAFLTNVFYLLWLAVRQPNPQPPEAALSPVERFTESRVLPWVLSGVLIASLLWAAVARPEFGSLTDRWQALAELISSDRLTYSFVIDLLVFWLFQAWLVKDDMSRRNWQDVRMLWLVRIVPIVGLVVYLLRRPSLSAAVQVADALPVDVRTDANDAREGL